MSYLGAQGCRALTHEARERVVYIEGRYIVDYRCPSLAFNR